MGPVVNGGSDKRSELGVSIFPKNVPYFMGSRSELLRVFQPSNSHEYIVEPHLASFAGKYVHDESIFKVVRCLMLFGSFKFPKSYFHPSTCHSYAGAE